jgi:hypothetical protein
LNVGDVGNDPNADPDVNTSHAAKHPIVAQYLRIGLEAADYSRFERQVTIPLGTNKKRPHATFESASPTGKQGKGTAKRRSASSPHPNPAKKSKKPRSEDGHARSATKTTAESKTKRSSAVPPDSNKENVVTYDSGRELEALPSESFALSEQTAQRLNAWKFQPSLTTSNIDTPNAHSDSKTNHLVDSHSSFTVTPGLLDNSSIESLSLLSPITSLDVIKGSQGYGYSIYSSTSSSSCSRLTTQKSHPEPQPPLQPSRPPPSTGHVLETIFEESPPTSYDPTRELPGIVSEACVAPICDSTESSSTRAENLSSDRSEDEIFDGINDGDLLDLDYSCESIVAAPKQVSRSSIPISEAAHFILHSARHHDGPNIIGITNDDEWTMLEDEEIAFIDLTNDVETSTPSLATKTRDKATNANISVTNNVHGKAAAQFRSMISQQGQASSPIPINEPDLTVAEATENYLNAILHPPIIRPPFPKPIRDRSPLIGVSSSLVLKTCFRIGECLNAGCTSARNSNTQSSDTILLELYAKVVSSQRDANGVTQHFVLADLFHEKRGPFLNATCETWKGSELWEYDCGRFLGAERDGEKKICRAVGRMKREGSKWRFVVLNIWEATWEDIEFVRSIVCDA